MSSRVSRSLSRRQMLKLLGMGSTGLVLSACAQPTPQVVKEVVKETVVVKEKEEVPVKETVVVKETIVVQATPSGPSFEQGELRVLLCCYTPEVLDLMTNYNKDFETTYPGVKVNQEQTPAGQNYFEKLQTLIAAGTTPDVFDMWEGYVAPYAQSGVLQNLSPFVEVDPDIKTADMQPAAIKAAGWQGNLYAMMRDFYPGPSTLFYNKALFDKAKQAYPTSDWSWNDVRAAAKALAKDTNGDGTPDEWGVTFENWFVPWLYWIWSNGGDVFSQDESKCTLTDPKSVEAIQYWADLVLKDQSALSPATLQVMQGASSAFRTGTVGMYIGNTWDIQDMLAAKKQGLDWQACLSPKSPGGGRVYYMHLECWANAKQTKLPQTAWRFIRDYQFKAVPQFVKLYPGIPLLKQMLYLYMTPENASYGWDRIPSIVSDANNIRIPGAGAKWDKISGLIQAELDLVFAGEKTAADAAAAASPKVDEELARKS